MKNKDHSFEQALAALLETTAAPSTEETLPILEAAGRVLSRDFHARTDQPPFDRSPLDGYAVRHMDIAAASAHSPVTLRVAQTIFAGDAPRGPIAAGEAARVMTGAPLPPGATCVLRQEDVDADADNVRIRTPLREHENYCFRGEDARAGRLLIRGGERLTSARIGVLAGQGYPAVEVFARPRVGILSTGSELVPPGQPLSPGKIYDSNLHTLAARAAELGGLAQPGKSTADEPAALAEAALALLAECDIVVTTGGVSVGAHDYMPRVGEAIGAELLFHGVGLKPGGWAMALQKDGKPLLCLSGNPFAASATFELLAAPVIRRLAGLADPMPVRARGVMRDAFPKASRGRRFLRARIEGADVRLPAEGHSSGSLSSFMGCNCLLDIPAGSPPLLPGDEVEAVLL